MTEEEIADITLAEAWTGENGFDSDCNNINSVEANRELVNAFLAGLKAKEQWHKVADGDLPKENNKIVLCYCCNGYHGNIGNYVYRLYTKQEFSEHKVVAWCELPTFKE